MVYDLDALKMPPPSPPTPAKQLQNVSGEEYSRKPISRFAKQCIASVFLIAFLFLIQLCHPAGGIYLKELLTAEEIRPEEKAGQAMFADILSGTPIPEAFAAFCEEVSHATH